MDPKYINYDEINEKLIMSDKIEHLKLYPKVNLYCQDNDHAEFIYHLLTTPGGLTTDKATEIYNELCSFINSNYPNYCVLMRYATTEVIVNSNHFLDGMGGKFPGYIGGLYLCKKHLFGHRKHEFIKNSHCYTELYKIFNELRK